MSQYKVTIVGAGCVGASTAFGIAEKELADIVMLDVISGMPQGKALDLQQVAPLIGSDSRIYGTGAYEDTAGSDIVVITAGIARTPGMTRADLLQTNGLIVRKVTEQVAAYSPEACIIVVTNPVVQLTHTVYMTSGFPPRRVMGMAGVLDTARLRTFLAMELNVSVEDVSAVILGGHGENMVPLIRYATVGGIPVIKLLDSVQLDAILDRTRHGGDEIVSLLKTGSAYYAPGAAITAMIESILRDKKRVMPTVAYLSGEYGQHDVYAGVPAILGSHGVERIIEVELNEVEKAVFSSATSVTPEENSYST